jgi:hypothetical protein
VTTRIGNLLEKSSEPKGKVLRLPRFGGERRGAVLSLLLFWFLCSFPQGAGAAPEEETRGTSRPVAAPSPAESAAYDAARGGLEYLKTHQNGDGSWDGDIGFKLNSNYEVERHSRPHVGVTALVGIAFLAGGHLPERGRYGKTVSGCIDFVLSCVNDEGYVTSNGSRMYSHAFATLFLAEVYGMTRRSDVERKLQESVTLIVKCQNRKGSWRYKPFAPESDMSVTVCQLMALRAARNVGIKVPKSTIDRAVKYVWSSYVDSDSAKRYGYLIGSDPYYKVDRGAFFYQVNEGSLVGMRSSYSLTAAGVTSLYNAGEYSKRDLKYSLEYLQDNYHVVSSRHKDHYFYWYGNYYAVQAMYIAGEPYWSRYRNKIVKELLASRRSDGHWDNFIGPGENFATAVAAIILQIPMGYLPIFER